MNRIALSILGAVGALAALVVASFVVAAAEREYTRPLELADCDDGCDEGYWVCPFEYDPVTNRWVARRAYMVAGEATTAGFFEPGPSSTCTSKAFNQHVTWT